MQFSQDVDNICPDHQLLGEIALNLLLEIIQVIPGEPLPCQDIHQHDLPVMPADDFRLLDDNLFPVNQKPLFLPVTFTLNFLCDLIKGEIKGERDKRQ